MLRHLIAFSLLALAVSPAAAASSQWQKTEGASIRLVTAGAPDEGGRLRGALEIMLKPGWKTYWRDPGEAGVPPRIDIAHSTNVVSAEFAFPAPVHVDDGYSEWAGYTAPVSLPVAFRLARPDAIALIEADVFLGVCETICIPVQARLTLDPGADRDNPADMAAVNAAYAALPAPAGPDFGITDTKRDGDRLAIEADVPRRMGEPALFVAAPEGYVLGTPKLSARDDAAAVFSVRLLQAPQGDETRAPPFHYTLVAGEHSVSGEFNLP